MVETKRMREERENICFRYGEKETNYLKSRDPRLGEVIDRIGHVWRERDPDLFSSVVHQIIGQQISTKALSTIWARMREGFGEVTPGKVAEAGIQELQSFGMSFRKASYIKEFVSKVMEGEFPLDEVASLPDQEAIDRLRSIKGIGTWTAEMILLFCMERPNVFSYDDLALQRGLRMVFRHRKIDRRLFEKYRRKFSPCCSVASLYLWEVAGGAITGLKDPANTKDSIRKGGKAVPRPTRRGTLHG